MNECPQCGDWVDQASHSCRYPLMRAIITCIHDTPWGQPCSECPPGTAGHNDAEQRSATERAFSSTPEEMGRDAVEAAKRERCPNTDNGKHEWKTDCSYGPSFCARCGLAEPG